MTGISALCLALTAPHPSLEAVNAALMAGGDPNLSCEVDHQYIGYHFERGEGLVSILIPFYGLGKLIFGGEVMHETLQVAPLALSVESRDPALVHALTRAGAALDPEPLNVALQDALEWGQPDVVLALLADGARFGPQIDADLGLSLLRVPEIWPALRAAGVSADLEGGETPLERAVEQGDLAAARAFLAMGASPDGQPDNTSSTPLSLSVDRGDLALAEELVRLGAHLEYVGSSSLVRAASRGDLEVSRWLLDRGVSPNTNDGADSALFGAAGAGDPRIVALLLARGARVNHLVSFERTALNAAASHGDIEAARLLIEAGAEVGHEGFFGYSALRDAISTGQRELVAMLIGAGAPLTWRDGSAIGLAVSLQDPRMVRLLVAAGADLDQTDSSGRSALDRAVIANNPTATRQLMGYGAALGLSERHAHTALHAAAEAGSVEGVLLALELGVAVDAPDAWGRSALMGAAEACRLETSALLLERGARPDTRDRDGRGPGHAAARCGDAKILNILIKSGVDLSAPDALGRTPAHAVVLERPWALDALIAAGAPLNLPDLAGQTPLHLAMLAESEIDAEDVAEALVQAGVSADLADAQGRTALDLAVGRRNLDLVRLALKAPHRAPAAPYAFDADTFQWHFNDADLIMGLLLEQGLPVALDGGPETAASAGKVQLSVDLAKAGAPVSEAALGYALATGDLRGADALAAYRPALDSGARRRLLRLLRREDAPPEARAWVEEHAG